MTVGAGGDRAREGFDHLQEAALQLIAASRVFLDIAEEVVKDPGAVSDAVRSFASGAVAGARGEPTPGRSAERPGPGPSAGRRGSVRRIDVS